jgi:hypothetical protein
MTAWQHISPEVSVKGFKKCFISNRVDGTADDDVLKNDSEEEGGVRSVCEEDEGTDCEMEKVTLNSKSR